MLFDSDEGEEEEEEVKEGDEKRRKSKYGDLIVEHDKENASPLTPDSTLRFKKDLE